MSRLSAIDATPTFGTPEWTEAFDQTAAAAFQHVSEAMDGFRQQLERSSSAFEAAIRKIGAAVEVMRGEHPEWFDPQTGYLIDRDV